MIALPDEIAGILRWLDEKPTLSRTVGAARRLDGFYESHPTSTPLRRLLVARNFTIEPFEPMLKVAGHRRGLRFVVSYSSYDPTADELLPGAAEADHVILALRLEELAPALTSEMLEAGSGEARALADDVVDHIAGLTRAIRSGSPASLLVHNLVAPAVAAAGLADAQEPAGQTNLVRMINVRLAEALQPIDGAHIVDVEHLFARLGLDQCVDARGGRGAGAPLSQAALRSLADADVRSICATRGPTVKCVVVDCDDTLWGGIVGEDGIGGIVLGETGAGRHHRDLQQELLDIRRRGVVLAICSKNEPDDVLAVLREHPDCLLHEDDFVAMRVSWEEKAESLLAIAEELNLGLEHLLLIDDHPAECASVRARLPTVHVVQWPHDLPPSGRLDDLGLFDSLLSTDEDRGRTASYQAEAQRQRARAEAGSLEEHLRSLDMVATLGPAGPAHLARVAQLTQRTNQFNLTVRRYDRPELEQMLEDTRCAVEWIELRDRFGGHGIVGCGIVRLDEDAVAAIEALMLSCRVLGRSVEAVLVAHLARIARSMGASVLEGRYVPAERNAQVAELYPRLGFAPREESSNLWHWSLDRGELTVPDWFEIIKVGEGTA